VPCNLFSAYFTSFHFFLKSITGVLFIYEFCLSVVKVTSGILAIVPFSHLFSFTSIFTTQSHPLKEHLF